MVRVQRGVAALPEPRRQSVRLDVPYPTGLNRLLPLVKWFPRGLFDYLVGVGRWTNRVTAYAFLLVTDEYPPFRLRA